MKGARQDVRRDALAKSFESHQKASAKVGLRDLSSCCLQGRRFQVDVEYAQDGIEEFRLRQQLKSLALEVERTADVSS